MLSCAYTFQKISQGQLYSTQGAGFCSYLPYDSSDEN